VAYRMAPLQVTVSDLEGHFSYLKLYKNYLPKKYCTYYLGFAHRQIGNHVWL